MRLLIDTNIVLDFLLRRNGTVPAKDLFERALLHGDDEFVTASSVTDIMYIFNLSEEKRNKELPEGQKLTKHQIAMEVQRKMESLLSFLKILPVTNANIHEALALKWDDGEDALQYIVALRNNMDVIITRNKKDFADSSIQVMTPDEFLAKHQR